MNISNSQVNAHPSAIGHNSVHPMENLPEGKESAATKTTNQDTVSISTPNVISVEASQQPGTRSFDQAMIQKKLNDAFPSPKISQRSKRLYDAVSFFGKTLNNKDWENFITGALKAGEDFDTFILTAEKLFGESGGSEKDLSRFLEFSAGLSDKNLDHFLHASDKNFQEISALMKNASMLRQDEDGFNAYLQAARLSGRNLDRLNRSLENIIEAEQGSGELGRYLSAAVKSGTQILDFVSATHGMDPETRARISGFMNQESEQSNLDNFVEFTSFANEEAISKVLDMTETLSDSGKSDLLKAAAMSKGHTNKFIERLTTIEDSDPEALIDFITVSARAEKKIGLVLELSGELDFKFMSGLSVPDTANYLEAAQSAGTSLEEFTRMADQMEDKDKSLFLYAARARENDFNLFLGETSVAEALGNRSEFLLKAANQGETDPDDPFIYMKGILSHAGYEDFKKAASYLEGHEARHFADTVSNLETRDRTGFLSAARAAGEDVSGFVSLFEHSLSAGEKKDFLEVTSGIALSKKGALVRNMLKAGSGSAGSFVRLAKKVKEDDFSGHMFDNFLLAANHTKDRAEMQKFINYSETLDKAHKEVFFYAAAKPRNSNKISEMIAFGESLKGNDRYEISLETRNRLLALKDDESIFKLALKIGPERPYIGSFLSKYVLETDEDLIDYKKYLAGSQ